MVLPDRGGSYANQRFSLLLKPSETPMLCRAKHPRLLLSAPRLVSLFGEGVSVGGRAKAVSFLRL